MCRAPQQPQVIQACASDRSWSSWGQGNCVDADVSSVQVLDPSVRAAEQFWQAHRAQRLIGLRTSGTTTGRPRTIVRTTQSWVGSFDAVARRCELGPSDEVWIPGPMSATMNLFAACLAEHVGASWTAAGEESASVAQLTPAGLVRLLDEEPSRHRELRAVIVAGDTLSAALSARAEAAGLNLTHYYGAAELSMVAIGSSASDLVPFDQVDVRVDHGVVRVRSPWLCTGVISDDGYVDLARDAEGFATVGDHGHLDAGRLFVDGRDGAVTTAGQTVALAPLLARMKGVVAGEVFLVGVPHPWIGQVLTAVVTNTDDLAVLRHWARRELAGAERPRRWECVTKPPLTPAGKVDVRALAEQLGKRGSSSAATGGKR